MMSWVVDRRLHSEQAFRLLFLIAFSIFATWLIIDWKSLAYRSPRIRRTWPALELLAGGIAKDGLKHIEAGRQAEAQFQATPVNAAQLPSPGDPVGDPLGAGESGHRGEPGGGRWAGHAWWSFNMRDVLFVRNVLTPVPTDYITTESRRLNILIVSAQPAGTISLSEDEERSLIERSFQPLTDSGGVRIDVIPKATPAKLHSKVRAESFDVIHFIGHGEFNEADDTGYLLFEDDQNQAISLSTSQLKDILRGRGRCISSQTTRKCVFGYPSSPSETKALSGSCCQLRPIRRNQRPIATIAGQLLPCALRFAFRFSRHGM